MASRRRSAATHSQLPAWNTSPLPRGKLHDHARAPLDSIDRRIAVVAEPDLRDEFRVVVGQESIVERDMHRLLLQRGHAERENLQPGGRAARLGRFGQTAADDVVQTVDLIAEGMALGAEQVSVAQAGLGEGPVLGPIHRKAADAARCATDPSRHRGRWSR